METRVAPITGSRRRGGGAGRPLVRVESTLLGSPGPLFLTDWTDPVKAPALVSRESIVSAGHAPHSWLMDAATKHAGGEGEGEGEAPVTDWRSHTKPKHAPGRTISGPARRGATWPHRPRLRRRMEGGGHGYTTSTGGDTARQS